MDAEKVLNTGEEWLEKIIVSKSHMYVKDVKDNLQKKKWIR